MQFVFSRFSLPLFSQTIIAAVRAITMIKNNNKNSNNNNSNYSNSNNIIFCNKNRYDINKFPRNCLKISSSFFIKNNQCKNNPTIKQVESNKCYHQIVN